MDCSPYLVATPSRSEADVRAQRQVIAERAELYERMLAYDEPRAAYVARQPWHNRRGHYYGYMGEQPSWAPLPHTQDVIAAHTLHCDASADYWTHAADVLTDWLPIVDDLRDSAETQHDRELAEWDRRQLGERVKRARDFAKLLRAEHQRRASVGRVA